MLYLDLGLTFTNRSEHPVILSRKIESPPILRAAKSVEDAKMGKFDYSPNIDSFLAKQPPTPPRFGKTPNSKQFVVLAPGRAFEITLPSAFWVPINTFSAAKVYGFLPGSDHLIQVGVDTWPYDWPHFAPVDAHKLSVRWATYGNLAYGLLYSEFVSFTVPQTFDHISCKGFDLGIRDR